MWHLVSSEFSEKKNPSTMAWSYHHYSQGVLLKVIQMGNSMTWKKKVKSSKEAEKSQLGCADFYQVT